MKKTLSTILAFVMLLALAIPASAESGEAAAAEPGGYTDKTVGVFRRDLTDETATVRYYADAGSIAYMSIADYYAVMLPGQSMTVTPAEDGKYTLTNPCGSAEVDVKADTLTSSNYAAFTNLMGQVQEGMENIYLDGYPFIRVIGAEYSNAPKPVTFRFGDYGIDLRAAWNRGLRAWREPGLPGRYCPQSAARALLSAIERHGKEGQRHG